jgi:hypothetical protein
MTSPFRQRIGALEEAMQAITFRAALRRARRAPDFVPALLDATRVGPDAYALDVGALDECELLALAGGEAFATWWDGLDLLDQMALARGERPPWRHATP